MRTARLTRWVTASTFAALLLGSSGCVRSAVRQETTTPRPPEDEAFEEPVAVRYDRTLIYPVQYGRAEDLAATLLPLLQGMYGPQARVVVHEDTNQLLIYIPPRSARPEATGGRTQPTAPTPARRPRPAP